jgi:hypothetical protein
VTLSSSTTARVERDEAARTAAVDFAGRLAGRWQEMLGTDLLGSYLIGSLAHAGFNHRYSDIDIALVTVAGLSADALDDLRCEAVALSPDWGAKVSVFWADRHFSLGRFLPLDRIDYLEHAIALIEHERVQPARPKLEEIRKYLRGMPFSSWEKHARIFAAAEILDSKDHRAYLRALLYPGRFCYSWTTGLIGSNDDAVAFLRENRVAGLDVGLIARALECRRAGAEPDALFADRTLLPSQIEVCVAISIG